MIKTRNLKKNQIRYISITLLVGMVLILAACYSDYGLSTKDYDVVATAYKKDNDFSKYKTYSMTDEIVHIGEDGEPVDGPGDYDQLIIDQVVSNMAAIGYRRETNPAVNPPDIAIVIAITTSTNIQSYYSYNWGGYWGGYYGWGYGGYYYPPYWWGGTVVVYQTGTVIIDMIEPTEGDNPIYGSVWFATINGLLDDTPANVRSRLVTEIDQAFNQSPYLRTSN